MKKALITGITGQDGAYLAKFLLNKKYKVYGTFRRISQPNFYRLEALNILDQINLVPFDLLDQSSMFEVLKEVNPDEIYNLAAQSFVGASFEQPIATGEVTGLGLTRLLDSVKIICPDSKFYQASTSEMYGKIQESPQNENTPFYPRSPYAAAKLYAHWLTLNYREGYNLFACSGILFNHESPLRGLEFVTRKITYSAAKIYHNMQDELFLGNIDAKRDWGFAQDYVEAMWLMLQQNKPDDYVIATGENHTVREFLMFVFDYIKLDWKKYVKIDKSLFRPTEVQTLLGDSSKAFKNLGWKPKTKFENLAKMMIEADLELVGKQKHSLETYNFQNIKEFPHFKE